MSSKKEQPRSTKPNHTIRVMIEATRLPMPNDGLSPIACPRCPAELAIHQPDAQQPDRLLATCAGCGEWFVLWVANHGDEALAVHLPLEELAREGQHTAD